MTKPSLLLFVFSVAAVSQIVVQRNGRFQQTDGLQQFNNLQQPGSPPQPAYTGPKGSISGTVLDSASGTPVKKAQVRMFNAPQSLVVTDASGSFTFDQLPPGSYMVDAQHPNYPPNGMTRPPAQITLGPGEQKTGVQVKVVPGASVLGRVFDDDGDPMTNCNLSLFSRNAGRMFQPIQNATTNPAGEYTILNTPAGKYYLQVRCGAPVLQPRPFAPPDAVLPGPQFGYASRYYPGTTKFESAQRLKLLPGQEMRGVDFHMALQKVTTVTVHVSGLDEEHRTRVFVSLEAQGDVSINNVNNLTGMLQPRTGTAQIRSVPAGNYSLTLTSAGAERAILARQPVQVAEEPLDIPVQVAPPLPVTGMIHMADPPTPATNVQNPAGNPASRTIFLSQADQQNMQTSAAIAADGSFTFHTLTPGHYRANLNAGGYVQSVSVGGETFIGPEFELKQGFAGPLDITTGTATGTLTGEIQLGDSHSAQIVILAVSGQGTNSNIVNAVAGQPVRYSIPLAPGAYRVYAMDLANPGAAFQLINSEALSGREEKVDIRASAETSRNLKLITAADIEQADQ